MRRLGLVLAGGQSRRMGQNKALLPWQGAPLFLQSYRSLAAQTQEVRISTSADPALFAPWQSQVLPDIFENCGPMGGLYSGLLWAKAAGAHHLLTAPCDMPHLPEDFAARFGSEDCAYARDAQSLRPCPTVALWPVSALPVLEEVLKSGNFRLMGLCARLGARAVPFESTSLTNLNTPQDLAQCLS